MDLNPNVKKLWLEALRSGNYTQGKNWLCKIDENGNKTYCCLGVLCDLAVKANIIKEPKNHNFGKYKLLSYDDKDQFPPRRVLEWAMTDYNGDFNVKVVKINRRLSDLNDVEMFSFEQIADLIEANL